MFVFIINHWILVTGENVADQQPSNRSSRYFICITKSGMWDLKKKKKRHNRAASTCEQIVRLSNVRVSLTYACLTIWLPAIQQANKQISLTLPLNTAVAACGRCRFAAIVLNWHVWVLLSLNIFLINNFK